MEGDGAGVSSSDMKKQERKCAYRTALSSHRGRAMGWACSHTISHVSSEQAWWVGVRV